MLPAYLERSTKPSPGTDALRERLAEMIAGMTDDMSVLIPVGRLKELLAAPDLPKEAETGIDSAVDFTVEELAEACGRAPSTVRGWIRDGLLEGYLFNGREYRVTREAWEEFWVGKRRRPDAVPALEPRPRERTADLGAWRKHMRKEAPQVSGT